MLFRYLGLLFVSIGLSWICHRQFIDLFLLPVCTVDSSQTCVALGSITLVVEMFIYIQLPHNSLSALLYIPSIFPQCFVCFNIRVCCLIFAARIQIMDCFLCTFRDRLIWFLDFCPFVLHNISCNFCMLIYKFRSLATCLCSVCILLPVKQSVDKSVCYALGSLFEDVSYF